jgi:hypothetical protein
MAGIVGKLERDVEKEWEAQKVKIKRIFDEVATWSQGMDVTAELDAGVVQLTLTAHFSRPSPAGSS